MCDVPRESRTHGPRSKKTNVRLDHPERIAMAMRMSPSVTAKSPTYGYEKYRPLAVASIQKILASDGGGAVQHPRRPRDSSIKSSG
jgi:hypothetical protein